jgi:hypothetical protein
MLKVVEKGSIKLIKVPESGFVRIDEDFWLNFIFFVLLLTLIMNARNPFALQRFLVVRKVNKGLAFLRKVDKNILVKLDCLALLKLMFKRRQNFYFVLLSWELI